MRTKTLLLTAVLATAGALSSMAQSNVFSVNVVGYINVPLKSGYNLIANQLNVDGTNNINVVVPNPPDGTQLFQWGGSGFLPSVSYVAPDGWFDQFFNAATNTLPKGQSFFLYNPGASNNITLAGSVVQGTNVVSVGAGYSFPAVIPPIASGLDTNAFPAIDGMQFFTFNNGSYSQSVSYIAPDGWFDQGFNQVFPTPQVGQGFLIYNPTTNVPAWTQTFNVQ